MNLSSMRKFWLEPIRWPNDPKGYVFMARALQEIGKARFGEEWTGAELSTDVPNVLDVKISQRLGDRLNARNLLLKFRPDIELEPARSGNKHILPTAPISEEHWEIAQKISRQQFADVRPALIRADIIRREFVKQCEGQELTTAYRPTDGGEMSPIPSSWWNTEGNHRFIMCQLNPRKPFALGFAGDNYAWIFVVRESLDRYLGSQPFAVIRSDVSGHLSPYLRLMLSVSQRLQVSPGNQPKKEVVVAELRRAWSGHPPLSDKLAEAMATLIREPESQLGRALRKKNAPKAGA